MKKVNAGKAFFIILFLFASGYAQKKFNIDIPFQKFVLKNGLTVIISEDHSIPTVSMNFWKGISMLNFFCA